MGANKREVFSERVSSGNRTYFFDVKELEDGSRYLSIREVTARPGASIDARIIVGDRDLLEFHSALTKVLRFLGLREPGSRKTLEEIRQTYPQAYEPWTPEQDEQLKAGFARRETTEDLARSLQRQPSAVRSRLAKLGLIGH